MKVQRTEIILSSSLAVWEVQEAHREPHSYVPRNHQVNLVIWMTRMTALQGLPPQEPPPNLLHGDALKCRILFP